MGVHFAATQPDMETPVVLVIFNRPAVTRAVFQAIAAARPRQLLVVADGPRPDHEGEQALCAEARAAATAVTWPCDLRVDFAETNLGCRARVVSGLRWAFAQVEEAIILEDDVLPDPSFFRFCAAMLDRFREHEQIGMVTGFNIGADIARTPYSYYFSRLTHIWGWATWRRAWNTYDEHMRCWPQMRDDPAFRETFPDAAARRYWTHVLDALQSGKGPDTWDYQWMLSNIQQRRLAVAPQVNLVRNLGFGAGGTHLSRAEEVPRVEARSLRFPLEHPDRIAPLGELDALDQRLSGWRRPVTPVRAQQKLQRVVREYLRRVA